MKQEKGSLLAKAYGNQLHVNDIANHLQEAASKADSLRIIDKKVDEWLMQEILYKEAKTRLKVDPTLEEMAEAYKKDLYIHKMESVLKSEQAKIEWTPQEQQKFIAAEGISVLLEEPVLQCLMVKVPVNADPDKMALLWKTEDIPGLNVYVKEVGGFAQLDIDRWLKETQVKSLLPDSLVKKIKFDSDKSYKTVYNKESIYYKTLAYLPKGDTIPQNLFAEKINNRYSRARFKEFINSWKTELYQNKIQSKDIVITSQQG
jgi:hypothetical protein